MRDITIDSSIGTTIFGFYEGISTGLWKSKSRIKVAKKAYGYRQFQADMVTATLYACYPEEYNRYDEYFKDIGNSKQPRI